MLFNALAMLTVIIDIKVNGANVAFEELFYNLFFLRFHFFIFKNMFATLSLIRIVTCVEASLIRGQLMPHQTKHISCDIGVEDIGPRRDF